MMSLSMGEPVIRSLEVYNDGATDPDTLMHDAGYPAGYDPSAYPRLLDPRDYADRASVPDFNLLQQKDARLDIDRIVACKVGESIVTHFAITRPRFVGHLVVNTEPLIFGKGVGLVEHAAQAACVMAMEANPGENTASLFDFVGDTKFVAPVFLGDTVEVTTRVVEQNGSRMTYEGTGCIISPDTLVLEDPEHSRHGEIAFTTKGGIFAIKERRLPIFYGKNNLRAQLIHDRQAEVRPIEMIRK